VSSGISIISIIIEVSSIVLGVLLALAVSEWQEQREKGKLATIALANIHRELQANQVLLSKIHDNNTQTIKLSPNGEDGEDAQFIPGVQVRSTAWDAMLSSGISSHIDYQLLFELSEVYSMQSIYRETGMKLLDAAMSMSAMAAVNNVEVDSDHFLSQFQNYFDMLLTMEERLLQGYEGALDKTDGFSPAMDGDPADY
jgi:hypothetical protein